MQPIRTDSGFLADAVITEYPRRSFPSYMQEAHQNFHSNEQNVVFPPQTFTLSAATATVPQVLGISVHHTAFFTLWKLH